MKINKLKYNRFLLFCRLLLETFSETLQLALYLSNGNRYNDKKKFETDLIIRAHAIEKGLSIKNVRVGFGQEKILSLLNDLDIYRKKHHDRQFIWKILSIVDEYIFFNQKNEFENIIINQKNEFLKKELGERLETPSGTLLKGREEINKNISSSFDVFSLSRFSVRNYSNQPIEKKKIYDALKLAEKTPTACNRQPQKVYLYWNKERRNELFNLQGGCKGFYEDMQCAILITFDLNRYNLNEIHQPYVDGGLYCMNLLYALHFNGLATIPLTMGFKSQKAKRICKKFNIPSNEVLVLLIGVGTYADCYNVAVSHRDSFTSYTKEIL